MYNLEKHFWEKSIELYKKDHDYHCAIECLAESGDRKLAESLFSWLVDEEAHSYLETYLHKVI